MVEPAVLSSHPIVDALSTLLLFFGIAGVVVPLLQRARLSPVLAYLACGIAVGPFGLATFATHAPWLHYVTIRDTDKVHLLAELGIVTLMFVIGLELSLDRLKEMRRYIFGLGSLQILLTAVVIFGVALAFGNRIEAAILVGASLALSSTAIVMQVLEDKHLTNRTVGVLCFSILLMQDLAVIPILVLASSFAGLAEGNVWWALTKSLAVGSVTVAAMVLIGRRIMEPLLASVSLSRNPEWLVAFVVFVVILCASITHMAGLSLALGAFLAGLLVAETEYRHEVETVVMPLKGLLLGIFFLSIGMQIHLGEVMQHPYLLLVSVLGIYLVKAAVLFPLCLLFQIPGRRSAEAAITLAQPGEFALLILGTAMASKVIDVADAQFFLLVTTLAMAGSPLLFRLAPVVGEWAGRIFKERSLETAVVQEGEAVVLIAGFGRVGELLGHALEEQKIPYVAVDHDPERVRRLRTQGFRIVYGDARKGRLWHRLHAGQVIAAVIAVDDPAATRSILHSIRCEWPLMPIIVRARDVGDCGALYDLGAGYVVAETQESSLRIAEILMEAVGTDADDIAQIIRKLRKGENQ